MKYRPVLLTGIAGVLMACSTHRPGVDAPPSTEAVVEYEKSGTAECLVPRLVSGRAEDAEFAFVPAEYVWLRRTYPGFRLIDQSLVMVSGEGGGERDELNIKTADGQTAAVCFLLYFPRDKAQ